MVMRYFKEGPKGSWRAGVSAVALDMDTMRGQLHFTNGRIGPEVTYSQGAAERNLAAEDWREVPAAEVVGKRDKPETSEGAW